MSERSCYLRDQADKCRHHASLMTSGDTRDQLLGLAAEYVRRAVLSKMNRVPGHLFHEVPANATFLRRN